MGLQQVGLDGRAMGSGALFSISYGGDRFSNEIS